MEFVNGFISVEVKINNKFEFINPFFVERIDNDLLMVFRKWVSA